MTNVVQLPERAYADAMDASEQLSKFGISIYVQVGKPAGSYCGATILFDFHANADVGGAAVALLKTTRDRFYADKDFREAISHECFQLGSYVQGWNEPTQNPNF